MPVPFDEGAVAGVAIDDPQRSHSLRDDQPWARNQARRRHDEVLWLYGEYCIIVLMWRVEDHAAGLVDRCSECWQAENKVADAYGQGTTKKCSTCYGSFFEGGFKAQIYRPTIWDHNEPNHEEARRGKVERQTASVQTTSGFTLRKGDYLFRSDGSRWQVQTQSTNHLRTGFGTTSIPGTSIGWNFGSVVREDEAAPIYLMEPTASQQKDRLERAQCERWPADHSTYEIIRGPLL